MGQASIDTDRTELHQLLDHIPASDLPTARKILQALVDPVWLAMLTAPPDDEPLSDAEKAGLEAADQREQRGESLIPHEEILREFGLNQLER